MAALETYLGQIYISNKKLSKSFVSLKSEKIAGSEVEIYAIVEILLNSSKKWPAYERISEILISTLQQNFRRPNENSFENSIAQINEDLAKLVSAGESSWVGKINACVAARHNNSFFIATTGKIQAYLFRNSHLIDLADSPEKSNPLKTFENFAVGALKKGDFAILSTPSLFNYVSLERFKKLLSSGALSKACENIAETMKEIADQTVSFGTFILEFQTPGFSENTIISEESGKDTIKKTALAAAGITGAILKKAGNKAIEYGKDPKKLPIPKIDPQELKQQAKKYSDLKKIKSLPRTKKFFLASALIFFVLLIADLGVVAHAKSIKKRNEALQTQLNAVQDKINQANISSIYNNNPAETINLLNQAEDLLNKVPNDPLVSNQKSKVAEELDKLINTAGHVQNANPTIVITISDSADRISYANGNLYLISSTTGQGSSYNLKTGSLQPGANSASDSIVLAKAGALPNVGLTFSSQSRVILTKSSIFIMDPQSKEIALVSRSKGTLLAQYKSDNFSDLKDIAVDEAGKAIYILNGKTVLTFLFG